MSYMSMKQGMKLRQGLAMTFRLQQSIRLLTLPCQELKETVQKELMENPLLEAGETASASETFDREDWKQKMVTASFKSFQQRHSVLPSFETYTAERVSLKSHLLWQAQMDSFSEKEKSLLCLLISHLDDRGYLNSSLEELREASGWKTAPSPKDFERALKKLQSMDPPGVGSRNLKECLLIQARFMEEDTGDMKRLIQNHLHNLEKRDHRTIASDLKISPEEVGYLAQIVASMDPVPARGFLQPPAVYVTPDVYIYREGGDYKVSINDEGVPALRLIDAKKGWLRNSGQKGEAVRKYIQERKQAGQWFIRSLMQRRETIQKVTESLIRRQRGFLDSGFSALKPLVLQDVAEDVDVHVSTVSRVTSNKYAHTPRGLIPLKRFFSSGIRNIHGHAVPVELIKLKIKKLIAGESSLRPLSDSRLTDHIQKDLSVSLNRRTVAQYRDSLEILPVRRRKRAV